MYTWTWKKQKQWSPSQNKWSYWTHIYIRSRRACKTSSLWGWTLEEGKHPTPPHPHNSSLQSQVVPRDSFKSGSLALVITPKMLLSGQSGSLFPILPLLLWTHQGASATGPPLSSSVFNLYGPRSAPCPMLHSVLSLPVYGLPTEFSAIPFHLFPPPSARCSWGLSCMGCWEDVGEG